MPASLSLSHTHKHLSVSFCLLFILLPHILTSILLFSYAISSWYSGVVTHSYWCVN